MINMYKEVIYRDPKAYNFFEDLHVTSYTFQDPNVCLLTINP